MRTSSSQPLLTTFAILCAVTPGCTCTDLPAAQPAVTAPWSDEFDRAAIGADWKATDEAAFKIEGGELVAARAHNHPMWLQRPIPRDAKIEFDCWSNDDAGDIKVEIWGDGKSFATDLYGQYTSTAYNFIFGGWHNQLSAITRLHEHSDDRKVRADKKVVKGQRYHWEITRKGGHIEWKIDGQPFLAFDDAQPLEGPQHSYFAIADWEAELHFDHLRITPI